MLCRERPGGWTDSSEGTAREDELARVHLAFISLRALASLTRSGRSAACRRHAAAAALVDPAAAPAASDQP
eukprot:5925186-Pleurochrysis_carterae.AAC.1